jgi:hypothetical protein
MPNILEFAARKNAKGVKEAVPEAKKVEPKK